MMIIWVLKLFWDVAGTLEITIPDFHDNSIILDLKKKINSHKLKREILIMWKNENLTYIFGTLENSSKRNSNTLTVEAVVGEQDIGLPRSF